MTVINYVFMMIANTLVKYNVLFNLETPTLVVFPFNKIHFILGDMMLFQQKRITYQAKLNSCSISTQ